MLGSLRWGWNNPWAVQGAITFVSQVQFQITDYSCLFPLSHGYSWWEWWNRNGDQIEMLGCFGMGVTDDGMGCGQIPGSIWRWLPSSFGGVRAAQFRSDALSLGYRDVHPALDPENYNYCVPKISARPFHVGTQFPTRSCTKQRKGHLLEGHL